MKKISTISLILKFLMVITFYLWDIVISTSDNSSINQNTAIVSSDSVFMSWNIAMGSSEDSLIIGDTSINQPENNYIHKAYQTGWNNFQTIPYRIKNEFSDLENFENMESEIKTMLFKYDIKGASIAVTKDGQLVFAKGIGYADEEAEELVTPKHLFRIASVSKLITATTIMKMNELGLLNIDDKVFGKDGILNDSLFLGYTDPRIEDISIRHLLNHSSGWNRRYGDHMAMHHIIARNMQIDKRDLTTPDIIAVALKTGLHFDPGSRTSYSNLGYAILGEIIETITDLDYESYVRQTVLLPLGIKNIKIGKSYLKDRFKNEVKYYKTSYVPDNKAGHMNKWITPSPYGGNNIELLGPAGGWIASPAEIMKLVVSIDTIPGTPNLLSAKSIELMTDIRLSGGHTIGWAGTDGRGNWWRTGTLSGTSALVMRQNNGISWAVFFNSSTYKGISLPRETHLVVQNAINKIEKWPEHDLFYHFESFSYRHPQIAELRQ